MCGIAGFIDHDARFTDPVHQLRRMARAIRLRGPDDEGTWFDARSRVGFGFRRLSIQDLTADGHQPMRSQSGRFTIAFNGEVYNFQETRAELIALGHSFRGGSDTEVMLASFEQWGLRDALPRFVGMFAFSLWDARDRRLYLVRDRLGVKPLFWGKIGPGERTIVFASELKAIRALPLQCPEIDRGALALYMRFGYVPSPHCIFKGMHKVLPGHVIEIDPATGRHTDWAYWSAKEAAERAAQNQIEDYAEACHLVHERLVESVRLRMIADVPVGSFLSSGIDSTLVTAIAATHTATPLRTYTIGFDATHYDEAPHARRIAEHLGTQHTELYVNAHDTLEVIPKLADIYDEPFADSSAIPSYIVCQLARRDVTVALSGDGGDELFGGYERYPFAQRIEQLVDRWPYSMRIGASVAARGASLLPGALLHPFRGKIPGSHINRPADRLRKLAAVLQLRDKGDVYARLASVVKRPELLLVDATEPLCPMTDPAWSAAIPCAITRASVRDMASYMPDEILAKMDRVSMAHSLEAREPLTDHRLLELALRLPARFKYANGRNKIILRDVLDRYVPRELMERPKIGFSVPIDGWLRDELHEWASDHLNRGRLAREGYLDSESVNALWEHHQSGAAQLQWELWNCLMFETWLERWGPGGELPNTSFDEEAVIAIATSLHRADSEPNEEVRLDELSATNTDAAPMDAMSSLDVAPALGVEVVQAVWEDRRSDDDSVESKVRRNATQTRREFAGSTFWGLVQAAVQKGCSFLAYLIAAWTLQPTDVGAVTTAITIATLLSFVFPGAAGDLLMRHQRERALWQTACLWLALVAGLSVLLLCAIAYPFVGAFYPDPLIPIFVLGAAIRILFDAASIVGAAKLRLDLRFRYLTTVESVLSVITLVATAVMGLLGFAGWALLAPMLVAACLRFSAITIAAGIPLYRPGLARRMGSLASDFRAGGIQHYLNGVTQTVDYFAISIYHTDEVLGRYTIAFQLANTVNAVISHTVAGIAQPIFSRLQHDPARKLAAYLATLRLTLAVTAPICVSLAIASPVLVTMLLPERWELAWISLTILSVAVLAMNPIQIAAAFMRARGRFQHLLRFQIFHTIVLTIAVFIAAKYGVARHVAFAVFIVSAFFGPIAIVVSLGGHTRRLRTVVDVYAMPIIASAIAMTPQFLMLEWTGDNSWSALTAQVVAGLLGFAVYVGVLRVLAPSLHGQVRALLFEVRQRAAKPLAE